jgi:hypothetical protein
MAVNGKVPTTMRLKVHFACPFLRVVRPPSKHKIGVPGGSTSTGGYVLGGGGEVRTGTPEEAPRINVTVPVAVEGETLAVKIPDCPAVDGLRLDVSVVVVPV